jgi:hypothetical protein
VPQALSVVVSSTSSNAKEPLRQAHHGSLSLSANEQPTDDPEPIDASSLWFYRQTPHPRDKNSQWFRDKYPPDQELCERCAMFPSDGRLRVCDLAVCRQYDRGTLDSDPELCLVCYRTELNQTVLDYIQQLTTGKLLITARRETFLGLMFECMRVFDEEFSHYFKPTKSYRQRAKTSVAADERLFKYNSASKLMALWNLRDKQTVSDDNTRNNREILDANAEPARGFFDNTFLVADAAQ